MSTETMKAVCIHKFGGPDVLQYEDVSRPRPAPGELLIRVRAVGLNPPDWYLREGMKTLPPEWRPKPSFPMILGTDISGVVEAIGDKVNGFGVGDEVYSMMRFPSDGLTGAKAYAEFATVPADQAALQPGGVDYVHAAAAPMSLLTAWQFLIDVGHQETNPLQPFPHKPIDLSGKRVLVNGAGGGVGHFAVQLARWKGAKVIAVASAKNEATMRELGADSFIDYHRTKPEDLVRDVDLVVDAVGGPSTERFLPAIRPGGALFPIFSLGFNGYEEAKRRGITVSSVQVHSSGAQLAEAAPLLDNGTIKVVIDSEYALANASEAHERADKGSIQGKIVLRVG